MLKKITIILIMSFLLVGLRGKVFAQDLSTATSTINGITVNWQYELNESNQIEDLKCTNPIDLTGNITLPSTLDGKTVISLKEEAFKGANITGLEIPDSIKKIGYNAFKDCENLTSVELGQIERISFDVFNNCPKLTAITIPKTLVSGPTNVGGVFTGTTNLTSITFEDGLTQIPSGILRMCTGITEVTIPNSVTKINECAFQNSGLTEIIIPNSVKEIDFYAFKDCEKLEKVTILNEKAEMGWFNTFSEKDSVFENHNENLTIYCYENSTAARYAIANNIKYIYLTQSPNSSTEDNTGILEEDNIIKNENTKDTTVATTKLPYTGIIKISLSIFIISIASIIFYIKNKKVRDIE